MEKSNVFSTQNDQSQPDIVTSPNDKFKSRKKNTISIPSGIGDLSSKGTRDHRLNQNLETDTDDVMELKEAIIELYLAIKIRSTEEVSLIFLHRRNIRELK